MAEEVSSMEMLVYDSGAIVSIVLELLYSVARLVEEQDVRLGVGVSKELEKLIEKLRVIQPVLHEAEQTQRSETSVRDWLEKLNDACLDLEDVLDEWRAALLKSQIEENGNALVPVKKVCSFLPSACFSFRRAHLSYVIGSKIKDISARLDGIAKEKDNFNLNVISGSDILDHPLSPSFDVENIYGRDEEKNLLVSWLLESTEEGKALDIISIVGMGGIGKTTLAKSAYNDNEVISNFDKRLWVYGYDHLDDPGITKKTFEALGYSNSHLEDPESLLQCIYESIMGKKFLLVLNDLWGIDYNEWKPLYRCLKNGARGSKILITTRDRSVANMMDSIKIYSLKSLNENDSWSLFRSIAFSERSFEEDTNLVDIGKAIVRKCGGLPLFLEIIGCLLRFKRTTKEWHDILFSDLWRVQRFEYEIPTPFWLSYNDLPTMVKRCFSYCAIFPRGYHIDKEQLIKLWMAQGFLGFEECEEMEIIGQEYFNILMQRSFFHEFIKDRDGSILYCKMHDLIYDFAQYLSTNECLSINVDGVVSFFQKFSQHKVRHSMLMVGSKASFPVSICSFTKLRSLIIQYGVTNYSSIGNNLWDLFHLLISLRSLDLSGKKWYENLIKEIPKEIGNLMLLRYLNLSFLKIKELPETLCELYNLQTLELSWCTDLKNLPQGMAKLINLRHLVNNGTSLSYMPNGIERLTCLRTLSEFVVSGADDDGSKTCTLECLKDLNHLQGSLTIKKLGNVTNVFQAKNAQLNNKKNLLFLYLNFEGRLNDNEEEGIMHEIVLEALQPPPNLEMLEIRDYIAKTISPVWILSLSNLRTLSLHGCVNFECLPPLGKLPFLESLSIWSMRSLKKVGSEFLGIGSDHTPVIAFPKLFSLKFANMEEWEKWDHMLTIRREDYDTVIMPCLCSLSFVYCPKLKILPDHILQKTTLEELNINWCPILKERYSWWTRE